MNCITSDADGYCYDDECQEPSEAAPMTQHETQAEQWATGKLKHDDDCQINKTVPIGWPFGSFSCNCGGVSMGR